MGKGTTALLELRAEYGAGDYLRAPDLLGVHPTLEIVQSYREWKGQDRRLHRLSGHVVLFNVATERRRQFRGRLLSQMFSPGAFQATLSEKRNVMALLNHDELLDVGQTEDGSLSLHEDGHGLAYELKIPETRTARILYTAARRGLVHGLSLAYRIVDFTVSGDCLTISHTILREISFIIGDEVPLWACGTVTLHRSTVALRDELDQLASVF